LLRAKKQKKQTNKPDSVKLKNEFFNLFTIYLDALSPVHSSDLPSEIGRATLNLPLANNSVYMVFQRVRFTLLQLSPTERWALTPPFHLFPSKRVVFLSAALSVASP